MSGQQPPLTEAPKVAGPLWVISLFLGLSEIAVTVATTQASGWIQAMLAIFSVVFPAAVATVFFLILWHDNKVLYAPREFGANTSVAEYAEAMTRNSRRSIDALESVLAESLEAVNGKLDALGATPTQRDEIVASVRSVARLSVVTIDLAAFDTRPLEVLVNDHTSVKELLNAVFFAVSPRVRPYTYGKDWILRDGPTGRLLKDIGTAWAKSHLKAHDDERPLSEIGISGGDVLTAALL
ncbi:hypothetical protein [Amycolatopsis kentuckyensis]|uniref:hypothetical protein n=1 Tax=Amycolatopsis kentuckyensis TaxID=218823 RepID=UPI001178837D|nr:hypothetical protein [Amycolatopsis kentuckyensis]